MQFLQVAAVLDLLLNHLNICIWDNGVTIALWRCYPSQMCDRL